MADNWDGSERRQHFRVKLGLIIEVWPLESRDKAVMCRMRNVGSGGVAFTSKVNFAAGTQVGLAFKLIDGAEFSGIKARILRTADLEDQYMVVAAYPDLPSTDVEKIDRYIGSLRFLRRLSIFKTFTDDDVRLLLQVIKEEPAPENKTLFLEGVEGEAFYIVKKGAVKIVKRSREGKEELLAMIREGEFFGEMALLDEVPRSATAIVNRASILLKIERKDFLDLLEAEKNLGNKLLWVFIKGLCHRVRDADRKMADSFFTDVITPIIQ